MGSTIKRIFAVGLFTAVLAYAAWQKLEWLSVVSLAGVVGILYVRQSRRLVEVFFDLLSNARQAKYGGLEIQIEKRFKDYSDLAIKKSLAVQIVLAQMDGQDLSLLLAMTATEQYAPGDASRDRLRRLRDLGLLHHSAATLAASDYVWLTPMGLELAQALRETPPRTDLSSTTQQ